MHSSLHLRNISKLPLTLRKPALAAIEGSLDDLRKLCSTVSHGPSTNHVALLPVLYATLDPDVIPDLVAQLDSDPRIVSVAETRVMRSALALSALQWLAPNNVPDRAALTDLWPRCWLWVQFADTYRESLVPPFADVDECSAFCVATIIAFRLSANGHILRLIDATPGVRTVLVRGWRVVLQETDLLSSFTFNGLCVFLGEAVDATVPETLEEAIEGAGLIRSN